MICSLRKSFPLPPLSMSLLPLLHPKKEVNLEWWWIIRLDRQFEGHFYTHLGLCFSISGKGKVVHSLLDLNQTYLHITLDQEYCKYICPLLSILVNLYIIFSFGLTRGGIVLMGVIIEIFWRYQILYLWLTVNLDKLIVALNHFSSLAMFVKIN